MRRAIQMLFLLTAAGGSYVAASFSAGWIEKQTKNGVVDALEAQGLNWAAVSVDGLAVTLSGEAPDEAARFAALTAAGTVVDAQRVTNAMNVADAPDLPAPRFALEILRNEDGISLIGLVPARGAFEDIASEIANAFQDASVSDLLESADFPAPEGWDDAVRYGLEILPDLPQSKVSIAAGSISVSAVTNSVEEQSALEGALAQRKPLDVTLTTDISAPRPVISPFTLRFVMNEDGPRFDACSADTETARNQIVNAARAAGLTEAPDCQLGLGAPSGQWGTAAAAAIAALSEMGGGTLTLSNADVSLVSTEGAEQADFDRAVETLNAALPGLYSLTAIRAEAPTDTSDASAPPEFTATRSPEGAVQLRGSLPSEQAQAVVASFAAAQFGTIGLSPATRVDPNAPLGWSTRVLAGLEALGRLNHGALAVSLDSLDIRGVSGRQDASDDVSRILSDRLEAGAEFTINVSYSEALDPTAALPTPEECVASINAILAEEKITFAPSSSDIDPAGRAVLDQISEILRDCSAVRMEIGGHTDSQGRESMNLSLSQARADAVLNAILARRVSVANLTAKGYGEVQPIADNGTAEGREANRRIEFILRDSDATETGDGESDDHDHSNEEASE